MTTFSLHLDQIPDWGAEFSDCRKYRYVLWRIWDRSKPMVQFIGLNPSTANETESDPTIKSVGRIAKSNGYGGIFMTNCFPYVSTDPNQLRGFGNTETNTEWLARVTLLCKDVVFAWGSFKIVAELNRHTELMLQFPDALCIHINANGCPKHPLYCKSDSKLIKFK